MGWKDDPIISAAPSTDTPKSYDVTQSGWGKDPTVDTDVQGTKERQLIEAHKDFVPEEVKAVAIPAINAATLNAGTHVMSAINAASSDSQQPFMDRYKQAFQERQAYEKALASQHPVYDTAGNVIGFAGSLLTPVPGLGLVSKAGAGTAKLVGGGKTLQSIAGHGLAGAGVSAAGTITENPYNPNLQEDVQRNALFGTVLGGTIGPMAERALSGFATAPGIVTKDSSGNQVLTDKALDIVRRALPGLTDADIKAIEPQLIKSMQGAGASEASAQQGLLSSLSDKPELAIPKSKAMVTGTKTAGEAANVAGETQAEAQRRAIEIARGMADPNVSPTAAAEAYHGAEQAQLAESGKNYGNVKNLEGKIVPVEADTAQGDLFGQKTPFQFEKSIMPNVDAAFQGLAFGPYDKFQSPSVQKAISYLENTVAAGKFPFKDEPINAKNLLEVRKTLNTFWSPSLNADDQRAFNAVLTGWDNSIQQAIDRGAYTGNGKDLLQLKALADQYWNQFQKNFYPSNSGTAAEKVRSLASDMAYSMDKNGYISKNLTDGMAQAAQSTINNTILNPKMGQAFYEHVNSALGGPDSPFMKQFNASIRNNIFKDVTGQGVSPNLNNLSDNIKLYLRPETLPITQKAFGAIEGNQASIDQANQKIGELRRLAKGVDIINKSTATDYEKQNKLYNFLKSSAGTLIGAAFGSPFGTFGNVVGGLIGAQGDKLAQATKVYGQVMAERAGAPNVISNVTAGRGLPIFSQSSYLSSVPVPRITSQTQEQQPVTRASGGRINGKMTAEQLLANMEAAKKKDVVATKPLLKLHDTTVAHALAIANQHI